MVPAAENMDDGHKIFGEFMFTGHDVLLLHNEPRFTSVTNPLQEVVGESTESIAVGNDNF
jgi:hypothetical protein